MADTSADRDALVMYSTSWCGYCLRLKSQMEREGIPFRIVDIEHDPEAARFVEHQNGGNRTVPTVVFPNGTVMTNPPLRAVRAVMDSA